MSRKGNADSFSVYLRFMTTFSGAVAALFLTVAVSHANLIVSPVGVNAGKGVRSTLVTLTWTLTGVGDNTWNSPQGFFETPATTLGTVGVPLSIVTAGGTGSITESLAIPASVVDDAVLGGSSSFSYRREFATVTGVPGGTKSLRITITFASQAYGPVSLRRVELYFESDGRRTNEVTVARNAKGFAALADLYVNGTGYLEGYWEVDGRRLENIREYVSSGSKITIRSSEIPGIPTFRPGLHSVRLVVTNPAPGFALPRIGYIVTSEVAKTIRPLQLRSPEEGAEIDAKMVFSWKAGPEAAFVLTYTALLDEEVVLTAQTKGSGYTIPATLFSERFSPGATYLWQVKGYGAEGELVSESRPSKITVAK